ncbi:Putative retroelement, partial [Phytophthora palmivora]
MDEDVLEGFTKQRATRLGSEILKNPEDPVYPLVKEYSDVVSKHPPSQLPPDRGVPKQHRDPSFLQAGSGLYLASNAFFAMKAKSGMVRESKSPHSTPTFCVRKPNGKWRLVHAYNKLNNATVPAQTPIPRKDVCCPIVTVCTLYSALDLVDGYYQILMRESDIPLTAVSTPSGMLWEWLTYFDDIFVHSRAEGGQTAMEVHLKHLRRMFEVMRANKLYANIDKCSSAALSPGSPREGQGNSGLADPEVTKEHPEVIGLANYLHKYSADAELVPPLSDLLKKDADWVWKQQYQDAFDNIKAILQNAPVLTLPGENKTFSVVCDAERLCDRLVHLLGTRPFVIYTDHASLRTATNSPHLSQRMARWLSFFAEYNFRVEYKPGKLNVLADALSRRPDYELAH